MKSIWGAMASILNTRTTTWEIPQGITEITQNYIQANMPPGITRVIIPEGVTSIGHGAFIGCTGLMQITLPAGVTYIGPYAFKGCNALTQIHLPAGLTSIYDCAFQYCTGITEIHFSERSQLTSIGEDAFYGCRGLTQIVIPAGVTHIGHSAFAYCTSLTQMILPDPFCTDDEKVMRGIPNRVRCIQYSHISSFINDVLTIKGSYSVDKQALLYRLSSHWLVHPDQLKALEDCGFNDVMKAIRYRYSQQVDGDIRGLMNGFFGRPRNDQAVEIGQLINHDFAEIVSLGADRYLPSTLLSYMTVKDVMKYSQSDRGEPGLLSLKQRPEKGV